MPSDEVDDLIEDLKSGDTSQIVDEDEDRTQVQVPAGLPPIASSRGLDSAPDEIARRVTLPDSIIRVLDSPARDELIGLARFLDPSNRKKLTLVYHTPIGEVRSAVDWTSNKPDELMRGDGLMLVKVRSSESMFAPKPGAELEIGFDEYPGRVKVTCLAPPQRLYPGVDLLCFLPHNALMEKNGRLKEGAPSVVSGAPSTGVDDAGEPVADNEKSAGVKMIASNAPNYPRGRDHDIAVDEHMDFDKEREG